MCVCVCVKGLLGQLTPTGGIAGVFNADVIADKFVAAAAGLNKENKNTPVKNKKKEEVDEDTLPPPPPSTAYVVRHKKTGARARRPRQRHLPFTTKDAKDNRVVAVQAVPAKNPHKEVLAEFKAYCDSLTDKDKEEIKTLKEDLKRADQRVRELTTAKNLAEAGANAKVNTVTSLKRNLSKKTGLYDKEKEKAEILISNATRVQDQYRSHGPNHLAAFKSDVQKYVDKIFEAATVYYRAVDGQLDELTQANSSLHSTKRPAEEPLYSKDPHPSSR